MLNDMSASQAPAASDAPARLAAVLGAMPWLFPLAMAAAGLTATTLGLAGSVPLAWSAAGLLAGVSLSGSI